MSQSFKLTSDARLTRFEDLPGQEGGHFGFLTRGIALPVAGAGYVVESSRAVDPLHPAGAVVHVVGYVDGYGRAFATDEPLPMPPARTPDVSVLALGGAAGAGGPSDPAAADGPRAGFDAVVRLSSPDGLHGWDVAELAVGEDGRATFGDSRVNLGQNRHPMALGEATALALVAYCVLPRRESLDMSMLGVGDILARLRTGDLFETVRDVLAAIDRAASHPLLNPPGLALYLAHQLRACGMASASPASVAARPSLPDELQLIQEAIGPLFGGHAGPAPEADGASASAAGDATDEGAGDAGAGAAGAGVTAAASADVAPAPAGGAAPTPDAAPSGEPGGPSAGESDAPAEDAADGHAEPASDAPGTEAPAPRDGRPPAPPAGLIDLSAFADGATGLPSVTLVRMTSYSNMFYVSFRPDLVSERGAHILVQAESILNRFLLMAGILGKRGTVNTATQLQCAELDRWVVESVLDNSGTTLADLIDGSQPTPIDPIGADDAPEGTMPAGDTDLAIRVAFAQGCESLRLAYRLDYRFRYDAQRGELYVDVACPEAFEMPRDRVDARTHDWDALGEDDLYAAETRYDAHLAILVAGVGFATSANVSHVVVNAWRDAPLAAAPAQPRSASAVPMGAGAPGRPAGSSPAGPERRGVAGAPSPSTGTAGEAESDEGTEGAGTEGTCVLSVDFDRERFVRMLRGQHAEFLDGRTEPEPVPQGDPNPSRMVPRYSSEPLAFIQRVPHAYALEGYRLLGTSPLKSLDAVIQSFQLTDASAEPSEYERAAHEEMGFVSKVLADLPRTPIAPAPREASDGADGAGGHEVADATGTGAASDESVPDGVVADVAPGETPADGVAPADAAPAAADAGDGDASGAEGASGAADAGSVPDAGGEVPFSSLPLLGAGDTLDAPDSAVGLDPRAFDEPGSRLLCARRVSDMGIYESTQRAGLPGEVMRAYEQRGASGALAALRDIHDRTENVLVRGACVSLSDDIVNDRVTPRDGERVRQRFADIYGLADDIRRANRLIQSGGADRAVDVLEGVVSRVDSAGWFADSPTRAYRYFDSYASRAIYPSRCADDLGRRELRMIADEYYVAHHRLAGLLVNSPNRVEDAIAHARRAVELGPSVAASYLLLARSYFGAFDYHSEIETLKSMLRIAWSPGDVGVALYWMGYAYWMVDEPELGTACYQRSSSYDANMVEPASAELASFLRKRGVMAVNDGLVAEGDVDAVLLAGGIDLSRVESNARLLMAGADASLRAGSKRLSLSLLGSAATLLRDDALTTVFESING